VFKDAELQTPSSRLLTLVVVVVVVVVENSIRGSTWRKLSVHGPSYRGLSGFLTRPLTENYFVLVVTESYIHYTVLNIFMRLAAVLGVTLCKPYDVILVYNVYLACRQKEM
jgi:hypothetical protein